MGYRTSNSNSFRKILLFSFRHIFYIAGTIVFIAGVIAYALDRSGDNYPKYTIAVDTSWDDCLRADLPSFAEKAPSFRWGMKGASVAFR